VTWESDRDRQEPKRLSESLERLVRSMGAPSVSALERIFGHWEAVVGEELAAHSRPLKLDGDQLTVAVDDGVWASQLRWMTTEVLQALDREAGEGTVKELVVRVAKAPK
jgi:predicted nucleic acid-binding Zn ribbon protein